MDFLWGHDIGRHTPDPRLEGHPTLEQRLILSALPLTFLRLHIDADIMCPSGSISDEFSP